MFEEFNKQKSRLGISKKWIAEQLDISRTHLDNKIKEVHPFKKNEISILLKMGFSRSLFAEIEREDLEESSLSFLCAKAVQIKAFTRYNLAELGFDGNRVVIDVCYEINELFPCNESAPAMMLMLSLLENEDIFLEINLLEKGEEDDIIEFCKDFIAKAKTGLQ